MKDRYDKSHEVKICKDEQPVSGLTPRVVIILVVCALLSSWVSLGCPIHGMSYLPYVDRIMLPSNLGVVVLLILSIIAYKSKRIAKFCKIDLSSAELMLIYICTGFMFMLSGQQFVFPLLSMMANLPLSYYQHPGDYVYADNFLKLLFPWDRNAVFDIAFGDAIVPWAVWIIPLLLWFVFYGAVFFLLFTLGSVLYSRWSDVERLSFPLVTPIVTMTKTIEGSGGHEYSLGNKVFLAGLGLPFVIRMVNLLHEFSPGVPTIPLQINLATYITEGSLGAALAPWPGTTVFFWPAWIGIGFLVPTDFSFSLWFFYYVYQRVIVNLTLGALGVPLGVENWTFHNIQFSGGFLVIGLSLLWLARDSFKRIVRVAFGRQSDNPTEDPMNGKLAFWGSLVSVIIIIGFCMLFLKVALWVMLFFVFILIVLSTSYARFRVEAGLPFTQMAPNSRGILRDLFGSRIMDAKSWIGVIFVDYWTMWSTPSTSAWVMEGLKMADDTGMRRRSVVRGFVVSIILVFVLMFPVTLYQYYRVGLYSGFTDYTAMGVSWLIIQPPYEAPPMNYGKVLFFLGIAITTLCTFMRLRFMWWPFHPLGYVLAQELGTHWRFSGPFFFAWLVKVLANRWGGREALMKLKPFFVGMVISDICMVVLGAVVIGIYGLL